MESKIKMEDYKTYDEYWDAVGEEQAQQSFLVKNIDRIANRKLLYTSTDIFMWNDVLNDTLGKNDFMKLIDNKTKEDVIKELHHAWEMSRALTDQLAKELGINE